MRAKPNRMLLSEKRKLANIMSEYLYSIGGIKLPSIADDLCEFDIPTPAGLLRVMFMTSDHWLFCRFHNVEKACQIHNPGKSMLGLINPYTGKYNVMVDSRRTAKDAFEHVYKPHIELALKNS